MALILTLFLAGTVLVFIETFAVGGVFGVLGVAAYAWAVWESFSAYGALAAIFAGLLSVLLCAAAILVWIYVIPKTAIGKHLYLNTSESGTAPMPKFNDMVGRKGTALTLLAPSGKIEIDSMPFEAKSRVGHIDAGEAVVVVSANSFELIVEKS